MAKYLDLYADQNSDFLANIVVTQNDGTVFDLTGYTAASQAKRSPFSLTAIPITTEIANPPDGTITLSISHDITATVFPAEYMYDVLITDPNGKKTKVYEGILTIDPGITGGAAITFLGE